jgi:heme oxygenase
MNPVNPLPNTHTASAPDEDQKLAGKLRSATSEIHHQVNSHPFPKSIIEMTVSKEAYTQHLTDLFNIYRQLEQGIWDKAFSNRIGPLLIPEIFRAEQISLDITALGGDRETPLSKAKSYVEHLKSVAENKSHGLIGHAYVNYLGLFFGGRQFSDSVGKQFGDNAVAYYNFDELCQTNTLKSPMAYVRTYRNILSSLPLTSDEEREVLEEANIAFTFWKEMFDELSKLST